MLPQSSNIIPQRENLPDKLQYQHGKVSLYLPRFTAEREIKLDVIFKHLGLSALYNPDFLNISSRGDLFLKLAKNCMPDLMKKVLKLKLSHILEWQ